MQSNTKNLELPNFLSKNDKFYVFLVIQDEFDMSLSHMECTEVDILDRMT